MARISIITVCYNEPNLQRTCESVVGQSFQDFEWVVIDGGSDAPTQEIWNKYKNRIDKFVSEKDSGIYNAMNKGIKLATGDYLLFLNAGDKLFDKNTLAEVAAFGLKGDIAYGDQNVVKDGGEVVSRFQDKIDKSFFLYRTIGHQAAFIRKELFDRFGGYNENYRIVSDWEKWIEFADGGCSYVHIPFAVATFYTDGISHNRKYARVHRKERNEVWAKYFTREELKAAGVRYSLPEMIFSFKRSRRGKNLRILTVLGIHIKFKKK